MGKFCLLIVLVSLLSCKERIYKARSGSMEETIKTGESFAIFQTDTFKRTDIVVFDYFGPDYMSEHDEDGKLPMHWEKRAYRLIAFSGDLVQIKRGEVFVNGQPIPLPPKAKMRYEVLSTVHIDEFDEMDPNTVTTTKSGDTLGYKVDLTTERAFDFRQRKPAIISVKMIEPDRLPDDTSYAKALLWDNWSSANYGPLKIPMPGETISIDSVNFKLYHNIPGIKPGNYRVKEKLYFVLGDNRYGAEDSRFIGLITHSKMMGVVK